MKKTYVVHAVQTVYYEFKIEANSAEEAAELAWDIPNWEDFENGDLTHKITECYELGKEKEYKVCDRETGTLIEYCDTLKEAERLVKLFEATDIRNGEYEEEFYEIIKCE